MENLLIIDRHPLLRLGLKLLINTHLPMVTVYETGCRHAIPDEIFRNQLSVIVLGFDTDLEEISATDIVRVRSQFPKTKLIIYAGELPQEDSPLVLDLGISGFMSKCGSISQLITCLQNSLSQKTLTTGYD